MYKSKVSTLSLLLVLTVSVLTPFQSQALSVKADNLYLIKKMYIPVWSMTPEGLAEQEQMKSYLKQELASFGFVIVDDAAAADANLNATLGVWVTLDGPQPDPPKYSFEFELTLPNKQKVWRTKFDISGRSDKDKINRKAAQKMAKKLFEAWRKSAKKAGLDVGERVTS